MEVKNKMEYFREPTIDWWGGTHVIEEDDEEYEEY